MDILELTSCKQRMDEAAAELARLSAPRLTDLTLLPHLYALYLAHSPLRPAMSRSDVTLHRRIFVTLVLRVFQPLALVGGKMRPGLRAALAATLGIGPGTLSGDLHDIPFLLRHDSLFADTVSNAQCMMDNVEWAVPCAPP